MSVAPLIARVHSTLCAAHCRHQNLHPCPPCPLEPHTVDIRTYTHALHMPLRNSVKWLLSEGKPLMICPPPIPEGHPTLPAPIHHGLFYKDKKVGVQQKLRLAWWGTLSRAAANTQTQQHNSAQRHARVCSLSRMLQPCPTNKRSIV
eukprot:1161618-Pelagomonas_calceolata.AAC.2